MTHIVFLEPEMTIRKSYIVNIAYSNTMVTYDEECDHVTSVFYLNHNDIL